MIRMMKHILIVGMLLLPLVATGAGCGKMGPPRPKDSTVTFAFSGTRASAAGSCIAMQGQITGATRNVDRIDFELAPVDDSANCPTCPFNAREFGEFSLEAANYDPVSGEFFFSYCPAGEADMYRWRLVGRNIYSGLPYALTTPVILVMPQ